MINYFGSCWSNTHYKEGEVQCLSAIFLINEYKNKIQVSKSKCLSNLTQDIVNKFLRKVMQSRLDVISNKFLLNIIYLWHYSEQLTGSRKMAHYLLLLLYSKLVVHKSNLKYIFKEKQTTFKESLDNNIDSIVYWYLSYFVTVYCTMVLFTLLI